MFKTEVMRLIYATHEKKARGNGGARDRKREREKETSSFPVKYLPFVFWLGSCLLVTLEMVRPDIKDVCVNVFLPLNPPCMGKSKGNKKLTVPRS